MLAGAWTALAAGVSFGAIAFSGPAPAPRIGVIPTDAAHLLMAAAAGIVAGIAGWRADRARRIAIATAPLVFVVLPWLPLPLPAAALMWTGGVASLVWIPVVIAVAAILLNPSPSDSWTFYGPAQASPILPGGLSLVFFTLAAWGASPSLPAGDEPHYLVIAQSLLRDGDIQIANNHQRGDYREYFAGDLPPHSIRPGRNGEMYSIHAPGLPAFIAPAFALGGYRGVQILLLLVSACGCALAWWLAWKVSGSVGAAWFGWAAITASAPFLLESFTVFPDGPGAIVVLTGFWALVRSEQERERPSNWMPWMVHGAALAVLPWLHTRFAVLAGSLGGLILVRVSRTPNPLGKAVAFLAVPAISALGWLFFFTILYGAPDPSAPYGRDIGSSLAFFPNGAGGLLFDQGFGLLATAPVLVVAFAGFACTRRLAWEWGIVALPYLFAVATYAMWWAGLSGPARFLVPLILPLAIPAACAWRTFVSPGARGAMLAALLVSAWLSIVMAGAGGGRLGYHTRNEGGLTAAPWVEWGNHVVDLPAAFPAFVPQPVQPDPGGLLSRAQATRQGFSVTAIWVLCLAPAVAFAIWRSRGREASPLSETLIARLALSLGVASTLAVAMVWAVQQAAPITSTPAQLAVLRRLARGEVIALGLEPPRWIADRAWDMRMEIPIRRGRGVRSNAPIAAFPAVPAGSYLVSARRRGGEGWLMIGVGNDQFAIATEPIGAYDAGVRVDLPVDVRALLVRADEGARAQLDAVVLQPLGRGSAPVSSGVARRAARYGSSLVFYFDDRAFPEPSGFWVAGARATQVALRTDSGAAPSLLLRNGPSDNTVTIESGRWREEFALKAGEERQVTIPAGAGGAALVRIASAGGARPSDVNPASRDTRSLGVFVRP